MKEYIGCYLIGWGGVNMLKLEIENSDNCLVVIEESDRDGHDRDWFF